MKDEERRVRRRMKTMTERMVDINLNVCCLAFHSSLGVTISQVNPQRRGEKESPLAILSYRELDDREIKTSIACSPPQYEIMCKF